jgi:hypothetical protein
MKSKKNQLEVDFIQSKPLTKEEETNLTEFIKKLKNKKTKAAKKAA